MGQPKATITPETKVGELLEAYPELEATLTAIAPAFAKLRNPILRKTVAKVTSLRQAARVGGVSVSEMVNKLREAAGLEAVELLPDGHPVSSGEDTPPPWFDAALIHSTLDARALIETGEQPLGKVMQELKYLPAGRIYELITPFVPAPLVDLAKSQGYAAWSRAEAPQVVRTYFRKSDGG